VLRRRTVSAIHVAAMSYVQNRDSSCGVLYLKDDPEIADANPPTLSAGEFAAPWRPRLLGQERMAVRSRS
jgi:hypothetical protein